MCVWQWAWKSCNNCHRILVTSNLIVMILKGYVSLVFKCFALGKLTLTKYVLHFMYYIIMCRSQTLHFKCLFCKQVLVIYLRYKNSTVTGLNKSVLSDCYLQSFNDSFAKIHESILVYSQKQKQHFQVTHVACEIKLTSCLTVKLNFNINEDEIYP